MVVNVEAQYSANFKFAGARGINISCNPSPGELSKHGHLFSVMITQRMWNITEHNDKADRKSQSKALASAREKMGPFADALARLQQFTEADQLLSDALAVATRENAATSARRRRCTETDRLIPTRRRVSSASASCGRIQVSRL